MSNRSLQQQAWPTDAVQCVLFVLCAICRQGSMFGLLREMWAKVRDIAFSDAIWYWGRCSSTSSNTVFQLTKSNGQLYLVVCSYSFENVWNWQWRQRLINILRGTIEALSEARSAGVPRGWGLGRGAAAPPQHGGLRHSPGKILNCNLHRHPYPSTGLTSRISGCFCFSLAQRFSF